MNLETHPEILEKAHGDLKLRVWHVPNPPRDGFYVEVKTPEEGAQVLKTLARYDIYLDGIFGVGAVFMNVQGLEAWDAVDKEWCEWHNVDDDDIGEAEE